MTVEVGSAELRLRFSFVAAVTLMLLFCDERIVLLSLLSSLIHESGHLFFICFFKDRINYVELGVFGMRIERQETLLSYRKEALIAMGGIIFNVLSACFAFFMYMAFKNEAFLLFGVVNGFVAVINMIPVRVLDFGRCIYCLLSARYDEEKSEKSMAFLSKLFAVSAVALCVAYCMCIGVNISLIAVTIYLNIITFKKKWS